MTTSHEFETKPEVFRLGTLGELGLGNPNGIKGFLQGKSEQEQIEYGEKLIEALADITDPHHYGCIDGRDCKCNADGSDPEIRPRQAGGTSMVLTVAMNSNAPIIKRVIEQVGENAALSDIIARLEQEYAALTGVKSSAHTGGCGKANGTLADQEALVNNPAVFGAAKAIMDHPAVLEYSQLPYDDDLATEVKANAAKTLQFLKTAGYDGPTYVDQARTTEPQGVEELEADDSEFHGHEENAIVFILSRGKNKSLDKKKMLKLGLKQAFPITLDTSIEQAKVLGAASDGQRGSQLALIANLAEHGTVANRLPHENTPVYLLVA